LASLVAALFLLAGCSDLKEGSSSNRNPDVAPSDAVEAGSDDPQGGIDVASDVDAITDDTFTDDTSLDGSLPDGINSGQDTANDRADAADDALAEDGTD
jgi:hypothetical protein